MGNKATVPVWAAGLVLISVAVAQSAAQSPAQPPSDWRHVGNAAIELDLADAATGSVERVWYSSDGMLLRIRTSSGKLFETNDFETWLNSSADTAVPPVPFTQSSNPPERGARIRASSLASRFYAFGTYVYRSDDGGAHWSNLTTSHGVSLIGGPLLDLGVSPVNPDEIVAVGANGVFRTLDGGISWSGLNDNLPNLPPARILALPAGSTGLQVDLGDALTAEWQPGERKAWRPSENPQAGLERLLRMTLAPRWPTTRITAVTVSGNYIFAGAADGSIHVSSDQGLTWEDRQVPYGGPVTAFSVAPGNPGRALATLGASAHSPGISQPHVVGTISGGRFWDVLSDGLADAPVYGITADWTGNAVYVATERGVFLGRTNLTTMAGSSWTPLPSLPAVSATDVKLDAGANRLWAAAEGYGLYWTLAPHRVGDPRIVSSADYSAHTAAPGTLLSVAGARVSSATAGPLRAPVLDANDAESQIQVPYGAPGSTLTLTIDAGNGTQVSYTLPMSATAPAIWVNPDGSPFLLDSDNVMLDAARPAHPRARIQILATGLGAVLPELPAGLAAPTDNPPQVVKDVTAWLDGAPVQVTHRAVLAPGLIGYYLVEIEIPSSVNYGPGELYIETDGQQSNHVRVYIEP